MLVCGKQRTYNVNGNAQVGNMHFYRSQVYLGTSLNQNLNWFRKLVTW